MSIHESPLVQLDRKSLSQFYYSTVGGSWSRSTNWLSPGPLNRWFGVDTNSDGRVVELHLNNNHLMNNLPPEIGNLDKLTHLNLSGNYLGELVSGSRRALNTSLMFFFVVGPAAKSEGLPKELGNLTDLQILDLSHNLYRWDIPPALSNLTNLRNLDLSHNRLTGNIPEEMGNLKELKLLNLNYNRFYGEVPESLSKLTNLERMEFGHQEKPGSY